MDEQLELTLLADRNLTYCCGAGVQPHLGHPVPPQPSHSLPASGRTTGQTQGPWQSMALHGEQ